MASGSAPGVYFESGLDNGITVPGSMPLPISTLSNAVRTQVIGSVLEGGLLDRGLDTRVLADAASVATDSRYYTKSGATKTLILKTTGIETPSIQAGASQFTGTVSFGDSTISVPSGGTGSWQLIPGAGSNGNLGITLASGKMLFTTNGSLGNVDNFWRGLYTTGATIGSGGTEITKHISVAVNLDFPSIDPYFCSSLTMTVNGAIDGDSVSLGIPNALMSGRPGLTFFGWVSASDTVTVRACNVHNVATGDLPAASVRADIWRH